MQRNTNSNVYTTREPSTTHCLHCADPLSPGVRLSYIGLYVGIQDKAEAARYDPETGVKSHLQNSSRHPLRTTSDSAGPESLKSRRNEHAIQIIEAILDGSTHPALAHMFTLGKDGGIENSNSARIQLGNRRFSSFSKNIYNSTKVEPLPSPPPSQAARRGIWGLTLPPPPSSPLKWIDGHRQPYNILAVNRTTGVY